MLMHEDRHDGLQRQERRQRHRQRNGDAAMQEREEMAATLPAAMALQLLRVRRDDAGIVIGQRFRGDHTHGRSERGGLALYRCRTEQGGHGARSSGPGCHSPALRTNGVPVQDGASRAGEQAASSRANSKGSRRIGQNLSYRRERTELTAARPAARPAAAPSRAAPIAADAPSEAAVPASAQPAVAATPRPAAADEPIAA